MSAHTTALMEQLVAALVPIARLYSGTALKNDPTQIFVTGHEVWLAQQALLAYRASLNRYQPPSDRTQGKTNASL